MKKFILLVSVFALVACNSAEKQTSATPEPVAAIEEAEPVGAVARYTFAAAIVDNEPVWISSAPSINPDEEAIYFFTELTSLSGQQIHHLWQKNGEDLYDYKDDVGSDRWRTYSRMRLADFKAGDVLQVSVTDGEGNVLAKSSIGMPQSVINSKYLITSEGAGQFLLKGGAPSSMAGYTINKSMGSRWQEGIDYGMEVSTISEDKEEILRIESVVDYNHVDIYVLSSKFRTKDNIGVASTIDEFMATYEDFVISCPHSPHPDACSISSESLGKNIQFELDYEDLVKPENLQIDTDIGETIMQASDFRKGARIKDVLIYGQELQTRTVETEAGTIICDYDEETLSEMPTDGVICYFVDINEDDDIGAYLFSSSTIKDGLPNGVYREYHSDGEVKFEEDYKDGKQVGETRFLPYK
ncbi:MAG: DUF2914 domain-containing protein [Deferribacteraceae bacterium]|jgi:hypothetical protein|nr:DUF2914 domain-containing protein [Deferribacteraceae bacterium]